MVILICVDSSPDQEVLHTKDKKYGASSSESTCLVYVIHEGDGLYRQNIESSAEGLFLARPDVLCVRGTSGENRNQRG